VRAAASANALDEAADRADSTVYEN